MGRWKAEKQKTDLASKLCCLPASPKSRAKNQRRLSSMYWYDLSWATGFTCTLQHDYDYDRYYYDHDCHTHFIAGKQRGAITVGVCSPPRPCSFLHHAASAGASGTAGTGEHESPALGQDKHWRAQGPLHLPAWLSFSQEIDGHNSHIPTESKPIIPWSKRAKSAINLADLSPSNHVL